MWHGARFYLFVNLSRDNVYRPHPVHRLIAAAFYGPIPSGRHVDHINARTGDNRAANLRICTPAENSAFMVKAGRSARGERNARAVLTAKEVRSIRGYAAAGYTHRYLAERYGVDRSTISMITRRVNWKHV